MLNDDDLLRYSRQIMLPQVDIEGQERLQQGAVLIVGAGGLGCPVALYLAAAGIGRLTIVDDDHVELSNLQRQILHTVQDLGKNKAISAVESLSLINAQVEYQAVCERLSKKALKELALTHDVIVDCTDNFATRYLVNDVSLETAKPLVSGAAIRFEGQVAVFNEHPTSPCYRCLYKHAEDREESCSETGVAAPLVGIVGSLQAMEVCKLFWKVGDNLSGRLLLIDALTMQLRTVNLTADTACSCRQ
ncbi:MAG: molybdopterin-synthase adenylyltransferase MoeB [Pseudomonadota bacterium]